MADAKYENVIDKDPFEKISYLDVERPEADPFSNDELTALLTTPTDYLQERNYIEFACFSGLSTSEAVALTWQDIDWFNKSITINQVCVLGQYKRPKTNSRKRTLKLLDQAYKTLCRQKGYTFKAKAQEIEILEKT